MSESVSEPGLVMSRADAVTAVIHSIAQEDTALASILSAEAASLWKVIGAEGATTEQILTVSKSVQSTLANVCEVEIRLLGKLAALNQS